MLGSRKSHSLAFFADAMACENDIISFRPNMSSLVNPNIDESINEMHRTLALNLATQPIKLDYEPLQRFRYSCRIIGISKYLLFESRVELFGLVFIESNSKHEYAHTSSFEPIKCSISLQAHTCLKCLRHRLKT